MNLGVETFVRRQASSTIDLILVGAEMKGCIANWRVEEEIESHSDHNITFKVYKGEERRNVPRQ